MGAPERCHPDRIATYDLHLHSHWSYDALASVESHFRRAEELGVGCIAIAEHHVLDSQGEAREAAQRHPDVRCIPAAELTVHASRGASDLVCYGFPDEPSSSLAKVLDAYHEWQREYGAAVQQGMQALGYDFTEQHHREVLESYRPPKTLQLQGMTHVRNGTLADYFLARGFIEKREDYAVLRRRVSETVGLPRYPAAETVLPALREVGVLVALAHPRAYFDGDDRSLMDSLREELGLDGLECAHPGVPAEYTPIYRDYCVEHGMFSVGGSDCHTDEETQAIFARHLGPDEWLDDLLSRLDSR